MIPREICSCTLPHSALHVFFCLCALKASRLQRACTSLLDTTKPGSAYQKAMVLTCLDLIRCYTPSQNIADTETVCRCMSIVWTRSRSHRTSLAPGTSTQWPCLWLRFRDVVNLCIFWPWLKIVFRQLSFTWYVDMLLSLLRLYGSFDEITREWSDGVAAEDIASFCCSLQ